MCVGIWWGGREGAYTQMCECVAVGNEHLIDRNLIK